MWVSIVGTGAPVGAEQQREDFARRAGVSNPRLLRAIAATPREQYFGSGPWLRVDVSPSPPYFHTALTPDATLGQLYSNTALAINAHGRSDGPPSLSFGLIEALELQPSEHVLHVGCGNGYQTALLAALVGNTGQVTAVETDPVLAAAAARALAALQTVHVMSEPGDRRALVSVDAILTHVGVTHPPRHWLSQLRENGRLVLHLSVALRHRQPQSFGRTYLLRKRGVRFQARHIAQPFVEVAEDLRTALEEDAIRAALQYGDESEVRSLRTDRHDKGRHCWLHLPTYCLSTLPVESLPA
jgi:protein-L-isoaspartate(D-aspartate) O-methyltransferase